MGDLVTTREAAALLCVSWQRVRQLADSGELTKFKNPKTRQIRFSQQQVLALRGARDKWRAEQGATA
jgi:hypothetical protein